MNNGVTIDIVRKFLQKTSYKDFSITRVEEGCSTEVFRIVKGENTYYFRILPLEELAETQVLAHQFMLEKSIKVPKVLESGDNVRSLNNRSYMIVEEIKGQSLFATKKMLSEKEINSILFDVGANLAKINSIPVKRVGWMQTVEGNNLVAMGKSYKDFALNSLTKQLRELVFAKILSVNLAFKVLFFINKNKKLFSTVGESYLAHGDFSIDHIYQQNGKFTGIIDFGDIRGTSKYHDLAHFYVFETNYFDKLICGYISEYMLPDNYMDYVTVEALLFGVSKLWWIYKTEPQKAQTHPVFKLFKKLFNS